MAAKLSVSLVICLALTGCASVQVARDARGQGLTKVYRGSQQDIFYAMHNAVLETSGKIVEENKSECSVLGRYGMTAFSWGERVGIFCYRISESEYQVEVVSKRAVGPNITAKDWTAQIFRVLDSELHQ